MAGTNYTVAVKGDTSGARSEMNKLGDAAQKANSDIEEIDFQGLGESALNAARKGAGGLLSLAQAGSNVVESQNFVDQVFTDSADAISSWAEEADRSALLSERQALSASAYLGVFGRTVGLTGDELAGFSINLAELAGDLASVANTSVDDAVTAIGAAMRNEYEPLRKYGLVVNDAVLRQQLFEQTGQQVTGTLTQNQKILAVNSLLFQELDFAVGDVERTFGGFANQSRYLEAQLENLQAELGEGLQPLFINLAETANTAVSAIRAAPEPVKTAATNMAAAGVSAVAMAGGISLVYGASKNVIGNLREMNTKLKASAAAGSRFAGVAQGAGKAGLVVAAAVTAFNVYAGVANEMNDINKRLEESFADLQVAIAQGNSKDTIRSFLELAQAQKDNFKFSDAWEDWGQRLKYTMEDANGELQTFNFNVEDFDKVMGELIDGNPAQAAEVLASLREAIESEEGGGNPKWIESLDAADAKLGNVVKGLQAQGDAGDFANETLEKYGDATLTAAGANDELAEAQAEVFERTQELKAGMKEARDAMADGAVEAGAFADALDEATGTPQYITNLADIRDGIAGMIDSFRDDEGNINQWLTGLDTMTESGRENVAAVEEIADAVGVELASVLQASGGDMKLVADRQKTLRDEFIATATDAGVNEEAIKQMADQIFATPDELKIAIELAGQEKAKQQIDILGIEIDDIPDEKRTEYVAAIDEGDFVTAYEIAEAAVLGRGPIQTQVEANADKTAAQLAYENADATVQGEGPIEVDTQADANNRSAIGAWAGLNATIQGQGDIETDAVTDPDVKSAYLAWTSNASTVARQGDIDIGTDVNSNSDAARGAWWSANNAVQAQGPIWITTRVARASGVGAATGGLRPESESTLISNAPQTQTLSESQARGLSAGNRASVPGAVSAGMNAPAGTASIVNLTVNMPVGSDPSRTVALLKKYQRQNGSLPINVVA